MIGRLALVAIAAVWLPALALGADRDIVRAQPHDGTHARYHSPLPGRYPLSRRAAKIRLADRCWRGCQAEAGKGFQACLRVRGANDCVPRNDAADRYCLRQCRLGGGPWVTVE